MRTVNLAGLASAGALAALLALGAVPANAAPASTDATCHGQAATVSAHGGTITGTPGDDVIVATSPSVIVSRGGDDVICGSPGNDVISAGAGDDFVDAGPGDDKVQGGAGSDELAGGAGADTLDSGGGPGGSGGLFGGPGADTLVHAGAIATNDARSISITADAMSVNDLRAAGYSIAVAILPAYASRAALPVVAATVDPMIMSYVSWNPATSIYAATGEAKAGDTVSIAASVTTDRLTRWAFNGGSFTPTRPNLDRTPTVVSTESGARGFGLATTFDANARGPVLRPTSAVNLPGGQSVALSQGSTAWIFVTHKPAGTVLDALPKNAVEISFAASPHARVLYSYGQFTVQ